MKPSTNVKVVATLFLLQMIFLMPFSQAYVYIIPNAKSQVQEGSCYDESLKINVPVNEVRQRTGKCESMSCSDDYSLHVAGCGSIAVGPGMIITPTDYSKPYPDCCPHPALSAENDY
uniref:SVWC domain-containing protein n=1 Tax=Anopheles quadriannulatus TaxID=34691 RepID=A0A182XHB4_ANOQN